MTHLRLTHLAEIDASSLEWFRMRKHNPAPLEYGVVSPQRLCTCSGWPYPPKKSCI